MTATDIEPITRMMSRNEFAAILSVTTRTLENWEARKHGPQPIRIGRAVRYRADEVAAFVRALQNRT